jgi:hypothetical protein
MKNYAVMNSACSVITDQKRKISVQYKHRGHRRGHSDSHNTRSLRRHLRCATDVVVILVLLLRKHELYGQIGGKT